MSFAIGFPHIDPVFLTVGSLQIRWYGIMYILGILFAWRRANKIIVKDPMGIKTTHTSDFITWAVIGVIAGGRLGFVLFYNLDYYLSHPLEILMTWEGGMSFHGGLVGVIVSLYLFCRRHRLEFLEFSDLLALTVPIGIGLGRMGNFINGEHWGRMTDVPWGMVFPLAGPESRHPSQLYEAFLEGIVVFAIIASVNAVWNLRLYRKGACAGLFGVFYALARIISEQYRDPDGYIGPFTLGQAYSIPMIFIGGGLIWHAFRKQNPQQPS